MSPELIGILGGSALLVYSIEELSKSLQYLAGARFRTWINMFAGNRLSAILLGIVLSILLSSSSAVTVMLVGLANARLMSLDQIFSVILGASIGTTAIVHLFAFRVSEYGLLIVFIGMALESFSNSDRISKIARSLLFTGMMFFSMSVVVSAGTKLETNPLFQYVINYFRDRPIVSLFISAGITALIHSSAATIAFVMSMMVAKNGTIVESIPWVLGANLGTTATAYFASLKSGVLGKQTALGNLLTKVVGVIIFFPGMKYLAEASIYWGGDISRQIAVCHTLFNGFVAVVFYPFISMGVRLVRHLVPEVRDEGPFTFQYLDHRTLDAPELALAQAQREILRLADTVEKMVEKSIPLFKGGNQKDVEDLKAMDQVVDFLNRGIKLYITRLSQKEMTPEQAHREFELLLRTNDLENIGDIVDKNILELVRKNIKKGYSFSDEGWVELTTFHARVIECLRLSTAYFNSRDRALYAKLVLLRDQIKDLLLDLTEQHMYRLHRGVKESLDTTSVHLDLLGNLDRIADLAVNFTRVQGMRGDVGADPTV